MFKSPWRTVLVPLVVAFVSLLSGIFLRGMIVNDFQSHIDNERLAQVRVVASDFERTYGKFREWNREEANEDVLRALMLGMRLKIVNARGETVMTTEETVARLPQARKERVLADALFREDDTGTEYRSTPLMSGVERVGRLDVKFPQAGGPDSARMLTGVFVLAWVVLFSGPTLALGFLIMRQPAMPAGSPSPIAAENGGADPGAAMVVSERSEPAELRATTDACPEGELPSPDESASHTAPGVKERDPLVPETESADAEDADDADDEDMQPLAGDPDRITRIVEGLNNLNKARALGRALHKQPLELAPFLNALIERTGGTELNKSIVFNLECKSGLALSADPDCLAGILTNLIDNAAKAVKHGGTVSVSAEARGDDTVFMVKDTGTGIRRKALPHLFEQYYRGSGSGIGLGLTIVRELVDACGGDIHVETARGKGSAFTVSLPSS